MLVLSMNSKRQRRPNVRLGEIGDVSAAFACGFSQRTTVNMGHKRWKSNFVSPQETELNTFTGFTEPKSSEFLVSDEGLFPKMSADLQHNTENKNPNSLKPGLEFVCSDDMSMSKLNFGTITRKTRVMKRRGRSITVNNGVFGHSWSSKLSPQFNNEDAKENSGKEFVGFTLDICSDLQDFNGFKDFSDHDAPATSKEVCEYDMDEPADNIWQLGNSGEYWREHFHCEDNVAFLKSSNEWNEIRVGDRNVYSVRRWLEDLGFHKYADVFEMHEVDEETLPLLTLEDLKEMGVFALGPRRKLYAAIQQLRG